MDKLTAVKQAIDLLRSVGYKAFHDPFMTDLVAESIKLNPSYKGVSVSIKEITTGNIAESFREDQIKEDECDATESDLY